MIKTPMTIWSLWAVGRRLEAFGEITQFKFMRSRHSFRWVKLKCTKRNLSLTPECHSSKYRYGCREDKEAWKAGFIS